MRGMAEPTTPAAAGVFISYRAKRLAPTLDYFMKS